MKRGYAFLMILLVMLLLTGCTRTEPYEVKRGIHTYVFDPGEGTVTGKGVTCSYEVTILSGVETKLVLRYPSGEWAMIVHSIPAPNSISYSEGFPWSNPPGPKITAVWEMLELDDMERQFPRVEPPVWAAFLLMGLFCVFWPDKVPFTGDPEDEGVPTKRSLRIWRSIGAVCVAAALVLAGLYTARVIQEFYNYGAYLR